MPARREEIDVQRARLGLGAGATDVKEVGRAVRVAVRRVLRVQYRVAEGIRVVRVRGHGEEIGQAVEVAGGPDEGVDCVVRLVGGLRRAALTDIRDYRPA